MNPSDIKKLQKLLIELSFDPGPADGIYGPRTRQALDAATGSNVQTIEPTYIDGVDVSSYQGVVDWRKVASSGIKFAWVKCSEGTTHKNRRRQSNLSGARREGIAVGGYHFARPDTYQRIKLADARKEAENFLSCYGDAHPGDLIPVLDLESGLLKNNHGYNCDWIFEWARVVQDELGCKPMMYSARWATTSRLLNADQTQLAMLSKYPLWWAEYRSARTIAPTKKLSPWKSWQVWQWTGSGEVAGIKGKCDRNRMRQGTLATLKVDA